MQREHVERLLRHGAVLAAPGPEMRAAAKHLEQVGLIQVHPAEFVRCANPEDADFSRTNRHCMGRIYVDGRDQDLRCPECERRVFPDMDRKRRHQELEIEVLSQGVLGYVSGLLEEAGLGPTSICEGLFRANAGPLGVFVCLAEFCENPKFLARDWASTQPTCYLTVDPAAADRFLDEAWLCRLSLAELICHQTDLGEVLVQVATAPPPENLRHAAVPVYAKSPRAYLRKSTQAQHPPRRFVIEMAAGQVLLEGVQVIAVQAGPRFEIFRVLWERYLEDLQSGLEADQFRTLPLKDLSSALESRLGRPYPDETTVRRYVNRLQSDLEAAVKRKLGLPVGREDIIQTRAWQGQAGDDYGYRLNPFRVLIGPHLAAPTRSAS